MIRVCLRRLRALDAEHQVGQTVHHVLRNGGHPARPGYVPEHRRAAQQVLVRGDQTGKAGAGLQTYRGHRDQPHICRFVPVQPDHSGRRDRVLQLRGLDVLRLCLLLLRHAHHHRVSTGDFTAVPVAVDRQIGSRFAFAVTRFLQFLVNLLYWFVFSVIGRFNDAFC